MQKHSICWHLSSTLRLPLKGRLSVADADSLPAVTESLFYSEPSIQSSQEVFDPLYWWNPSSYLSGAWDHARITARKRNTHNAPLKTHLSWKSRGFPKPSDADGPATGVNRHAYTVPMQEKRRLGESTPLHVYTKLRGAESLLKGSPKSPSWPLRPAKIQGHAATDPGSVFSWISICLIYIF